MVVHRSVRLVLVTALVCSAFAVGAGAAQAAAPLNDDFGSALDVNPDSSGRTVNSDLSEATVETGEPFTGVVSSFARTTWFRYDAPDDGTGVVDLCQSTVDVSARVYTDAGTGFAGLSSIGSVVACGQGAKVTFSFSAGDTLAFQIGATGTGDTTGSVVGAVHVWPVPLNDLRGHAQTLSGIAAVSGWTTHATSTVTVPADASDDPTLGTGPSEHTVWYDWTAPATFAYGFTLCRASAADLGPYDMTTSMLVVQHWGGATWDEVGRGTTGGCAGQPGLGRAVVQADAGESYQIMVGSSPAGQPGDFELEVVPAPEDEGADPFDPVFPVITGTPAPGGVLTSDEGGLFGAESFRYDWLVCTPGTTTCAAPYGNPSGKSYVVPACPAGGYAMRVRVTGTSWVGSATTGLSAEMLVPAHTCPAPAFTGPGILSGVFKVAKGAHDITFGAGRWSVGCSWPTPCSATVRLKARLGGRWVFLGAASFTTPAGATPRFAVHVRKKALRKLRKVRSAKARLLLKVAAPDGQVSSKLVLLKVSHGKA
jgi:hypothetical protein